MSSKTKPIHENKTKNIPSEPEYITAECVRQKKMANAASHAGQQNDNLHSNNGNKLKIKLFGSVLVTEKLPVLATLFLEIYILQTTDLHS